MYIMSDRCALLMISCLHTWIINPTPDPVKIGWYWSEGYSHVQYKQMKIPLATRLDQTLTMLQFHLELWITFNIPTIPISIDKGNTIFMQLSLHLLICTDCLPYHVTIQNIHTFTKFTINPGGMDKIEVQINNYIQTTDCIQYNLQLNIKTHY